MKCPKCQAKLLPVDGELFCLQCGTAVHAGSKAEPKGPALEDTVDPILQKAIIDTVRGPVHFRSAEAAAPAPAAAATPPGRKAFSSMRSILASPHPAMSGNAGALPLAAPVEQAEHHELTEEPVQVKAEPKKHRSRLSIDWRSPSVAWTAGLAVFGVFLLGNLAIQITYQDRVFPGIRVGGVALGGVSFDQLGDKLAGTSSPPELVLHVGASQYDVGAAGLGDGDIVRATREAKAIGHNTPLPVAGLLQAVLSKPIPWHYVLKADDVNTFASKVASDSTRASSPAIPIVSGGQAFVIGEKDGYALEKSKVTEAINAAYGKTSSVSLSPEKRSPVITAASYQAQLLEAQNLLSLSLHIKVKTRTYYPSATDIGAWIVYRGSGQSVDIDSAAVARYVAAIPGNFDRVAAVSALLSAVRSKSELAYTASTRRVTATPALASTAAALPLVTFKYCVNEEAPGSATGLDAVAASVLSNASGWTLGGRIRFVRAENDCNISLSLMPSNTMSKVSPVCAGVASCQAAGRLVLSAEAWKAPPKEWKGTLESYRNELVNHEVGHWLGFDHGSCTQPTTSPVMGVPTVVIPGCSAQWYSVPDEVQDTKVWPPL